MLGPIPPPSLLLCTLDVPGTGVPCIWWIHVLASPSRCPRCAGSADYPPYLVTCGGRERGGALCMLRQHVVPEVITDVPLQGALGAGQSGNERSTRSRWRRGKAGRGVNYTRLFLKHTFHKLPETTASRHSAHTPHPPPHTHPCLPLAANKVHRLDVQPGARTHRLPEAQVP